MSHIPTFREDEDDADVARDGYAYIFVVTHVVTNKTLDMLRVAIKSVRRHTAVIDAAYVVLARPGTLSERDTAFLAKKHAYVKCVVKPDLDGDPNGAFFALRAWEFDALEAAVVLNPHVVVQHRVDSLFWAGAQFVAPQGGSGTVMGIKPSNETAGQLRAAVRAKGYVASADAFLNAFFANDKEIAYPSYVRMVGRGSDDEACETQRREKVLDFTLAKELATTKMTKIKTCGDRRAVDAWNDIYKMLN
jgi:hypothetical protein